MSSLPRSIWRFSCAKFSPKDKFSICLCLAGLLPAKYWSERQSFNVSLLKLHFSVNLVQKTQCLTEMDELTLRVLLGFVGGHKDKHKYGYRGT